MGTTVLGIVLVVIGVIALVAGIGGGIVEMFLKLKAQAQGKSFGALDVPDKLIETLIKFMQALAQAPLWLALTILGLFLVIFGASKF